MADTPRDARRKQKNIERYERRKGRKISNKKVEAKRARQKAILGGERKTNKDTRDIERLEQAMKDELRSLVDQLRNVTESEREAMEQKVAEQRKAVEAEYGGRISKIKTMRGRRQAALNHL